jgi:4-hydroxy-tetrahydrodipicolinate reductase
MIKIGFFGFGKTGKEAILPFLEDKNFNVEWVLKKNASKVGIFASNYHFKKTKQGRIYISAELGVNFLDKHPVDVVVDFSSSENAVNYGLLASRGIKIVSAVSKYTSEQKKLLDKAAKKTAIIWSPNITIGVNLVILVSRLIKQITPEADVQIVESHFSGKKEKSGTALKIAKALKIKNSAVHSIRAGGILGNHRIIFGYPYQTIQLEHDAISRRAFGRGALMCAQYILNKPIGLYNMENIFKDKMKDLM